MKKCLIIINENSGSSRKISFDKVKKCLGKDFEYTNIVLPNEKLPELADFDAIAVCGGDGTLSTITEKAYILPIRLYYFPSGTLNDKAKASRYSHAKSKCPSCDDFTEESKRIVVGKIENNDRAKSIFTYVFAAGSFTPIGYTSDVKIKKKLGTLAYVSQVLKEYRPHRIRATITADDKTYTDDFTLIMIVKSKRCFGFRFNKAYNPESTSGHLVAIRSPEHNGLLGCIEMFFPFFRVFFMGMKKERENGKIIFREIKSCKIALEDKTVFCKDGEKCALEKGLCEIGFERSKCNFYVIDKF